MRARVFAGAVAVLLALAPGDCAGDQGNSGGGGTVEKEAVRPPAGCEQPGPLTRDLLPTFDPAETDTALNPCLRFADLLGAVTDLIPAGQSRVDNKVFLNTVGTVVDRVATVAGVAECAYEQDRLAISLYADRAYRWSVGVVIVIRGDVEAALTGAACWLYEKLPGWVFPRDFTERTTPVPQPCVEALRRERDNQSYTVLWLGSSDFMCAALANQITAGAPSGDGIKATVKAKPNATVRSGPGVIAAVGKARSGSVGTVRCWTEGQRVDGRRGESNVWDQIDIDDMHGYIADIWLDTGGDVTTKVPRC